MNHKRSIGICRSRIGWTAPIRKIKDFVVICSERNRLKSIMWRRRIDGYSFLHVFDFRFSNIYFVFSKLFFNLLTRKYASRLKSVSLRKLQNKNRVLVLHKCINKRLLTLQQTVCSLKDTDRPWIGNDKRVRSTHRYTVSVASLPLHRADQGPNLTGVDGLVIKSHWHAPRPTVRVRTRIARFTRIPGERY